MAAKLKDKRTSITTVSSIFQTFASFVTPPFLFGPTVKFFGLHKSFFFFSLFFVCLRFWFVLNLFFSSLFFVCLRCWFGLHQIFFFLLVLCLSHVLLWLALNLFCSPCSLPVSGVDLVGINFFVLLVLCLSQVIIWFALHLFLFFMFFVFSQVFRCWFCLLLFCSPCSSSVSLWWFGKETKLLVLCLSRFFRELIVFSLSFLIFLVFFWVQMICL